MFHRCSAHSGRVAWIVYLELWSPRRFVDSVWTAILHMLDCNIMSLKSIQLSLTALHFDERGTLVRKFKLICPVHSGCFHNVTRSDLK